MSIRVILCFVYILVFAVYARRNWFISLLSAILLMAAVRHPDMPRTLGGIQGLSPWNLLMLGVLACWLSQRKGMGLVWDMPRHVRNLALLYIGVVTFGFFRLLANPDGWGDESVAYIVSEYFINRIKWILPGLVLFDACRTRQRVTLALLVILGLYFLLAVQVIRWMPLSTAISGDFAARASKLIQNEIGYNRVTMSMMLGGACWAALSTLVLFKKRSHQLGVVAVAGIIALGQALTGGRSGYLAWILIGGVLCVVRWRKLLPVIPAAIAAVLLFLPGVRDRMVQGVGGNERGIVVESDDAEMTSGRTIAWPYVIDGIMSSPFLGHGQEAMITTGIYDEIQNDHPGEMFPHPHNAYLEVLLDAGLVGFLVIVPFYLMALWKGFRLLLDKEDPLAAAVGGAACALVLALMIGSMGGQTFYPREGAVGLWATLGLLFRVSLEHTRARALGRPMFADEEALARPGEWSDDWVFAGVRA